MALQLPNATLALSAAVQKPVAPTAQFGIQEFRTFHESVDFKLRSAEHYLSKLQQELQDFPVTAFRRGGPNMFLVNVNVDGFLTATVSASDVLGRELNALFGKIVTRHKFYLINVLNALKGAHRCLPLTNHLLPHVDPNLQPLGLIPKLKQYRNCSSHTRLIDAAVITTTVVTYATQQTGAVPMAKADCYLPDDPIAVPCAYQQKVDLLNFCTQSLSDLVNIVDSTYAIMTQELNAVPTLPL